MLWFQSLLLTVFSTVMIDKKVLNLKTLYLGTPCLFAALRPYNVMQRCSKCKGTKGREETSSQTTFAATTCYVSRSIPPRRKCRGVQILSAEYDQQVGAVASKVPSMGLNMSAWPRGTAPHQGPDPYLEVSLPTFGIYGNLC